MTSHTLITLFALVLLAVIAVFAIVNEVNHGLLCLITSAIGGLAGYKLGIKKTD